MMTSSKSKIVVRVLGAASLIVILLGLGPSTVAAPSIQRGGGLFADAAIEGDGDPANDPTIVRTRFVEPDFDLLGGVDGSPVADVLVLNLFDGATFTVVLDRAESNPSGSLSWMGHLEGVEYGSATLVVKDGVMVGSVKMPGAFYQVRYVGDGVHAIHEMDEAAFPPELEPVPVTASEDAQVEAFIAPMADDGSTIDVLVVYTPAARVDVGGTAAMENLIDQAIAETNTSYANSGVIQRVNLVHAAEVTYDETGFDWSTTLSRLRNTSDGYMDNVHTLRDNYCADEVVLIVEDGTYCGLAYLMTSVSTSFANYAFALVCWECATGYYSFGHEMGHNMGARHDWYVDDDTTPYAYNHGYVNSTDKWRTVMAYNRECSDQGFSCARLQYWSNPSVNHRGDPMGVPAGTSTSCTEGTPNPNCDADNQLLLDNTRLTVSNFRDSSVCVPPTYSISGYVRDSSGSGINGVAVDFGGARPAVTTNSSGYYEQTDFDGGTYTVTLGLSGYVFSPVVDQVTVSSADVTHDATGYPFNPASLPFNDGFESGNLGSAWAVETDYEGRARVSSSYPHWGRYSLLLDDDTRDSFFSHASAILALNLSGESQVDMSFWWQDLGDENHADDGVFISDDSGATWHQAFSFSGATHAYTQTIVDLDDAASTAGMSLNDQFLIKFQFYDNYPINPDGLSDGYGIDDVTVTADTAKGPLVYVTHMVDDEPRGTFSNNGDGVVNCGEAVGLYAFVYNQGGSTVISPNVTITTTDPYITFVGSTASDYPDIAGLGVDVNYTSFDLVASPNMPFVHSVQFSLAISATNGGPWSDDFDVQVRCGSGYVYLPLVVRNYPPIPGTPTLNAISDSDGDGNYTVSWGAADRSDTYTLQEDDNASFSSPTTAYSGASTFTSITGKSTGTYYYRVKATNSWGDGGWSSVRSVTVQPASSGPTPGYWLDNSTGTEFYVTTDRAFVDNFAIYVNVTGCGTLKITRTLDVSIANNQFSFSGSYYASGTFNSATSASGTTGLDNYYSYACGGYLTGGPWPWSATWQNSSQPVVIPDEVVGSTVEFVTGASSFYTVTLIK